MFLFSKKSKEAKAQAERQAKREAAIAEYKEKRELTLEKFFRIAGLPFPEKFRPLADSAVSDFTADPRRLTENSVFMFWQNAPKSIGSPEEALEMAVKKNCLFIITNMPCSYPNSLFISDTGENGDSIIRDAYIKASHYIRSIHKAKVIAVTGSVGKTSTKEIIEAVLRTHYKYPIVSRGSINSMSAVTKNIQSLKRTTNVYLQEIGASTPRIVEISAMQLEADIVVYTNIGMSHIQNYLTQEAIAQDKLSLSTYGKQEGIAIINYDDKILMSHKFNQKTITYSLKNSNSMYYATNIIPIDSTGFTFTIIDRINNEQHDATVNAPGEHNILNAIAAYAVGKALGLKTENILDGISAYRTSGLRQNLLQIGGFNIFADCYNSALLSINSALNTLDDIELPEGGRKIIVLGDILGLGDISQQVHKDVASVIEEHNVDLFLAYGIDMKYAAEETSRNGIETLFFTERSELERAVRNILKPEDIILFKASHAINLGASIDRLFGADINESYCVNYGHYKTVTQGDFEFFVFQDSASVKTYIGTDDKVIIPEYIEAEVTDKFHDITETRLLNVEKIGKKAFRDNQYVREVILPPTVVRIRDGAFKGSSLRRFEGSENLLSIGDEAFADCSELETVLLSRNTAEIGDNIIENSPKASLEYK